MTALMNSIDPTTTDAPKNDMGVDPGGLLEYSVVFTDRSLNHMSQSFQGVMRDIHATLCEVYGSREAVIVPGGGTFAMEAVARQFALGKKALVVRNGYFSFRWSQILDMGRIADSTTVIKARRAEDGSTAPFAPAPLEEVVATIKAERPDVVFAPHVETSAGMILPDDYIQQVAAAVHEAGGLFVLDCVASGCMWIDMAALGVDILISAPQKGWSASPCGGLVMMNERAKSVMDATDSNSFAVDLKKWHSIMQAYLNGGHAYHATMPTDALVKFHAAMMETKAFGFENARQAQATLGDKIRTVLENAGYISVAADGYKAPGVVVSYTTDPDIKTGKKFAAEGLQIAAGVPLQCDEGPDFHSFRIGLFGLDKLKNIDLTVDRFAAALNKVS